MVDAPEREEGGDGDPGQADISLAHVDDDHQSVGVAAVVDEVAVETPGTEGRDWEDERGVARVNIEKR